jgi:hypothetical protein
LFQFFDAVSAIFQTFVNFIVGLYEMICNLLGIVFKGTLFLFALVPNLPPYCMSFIAVMLSIAILIQILNKGG